MVNQPVVCDLTNKHCVPCEGGIPPLTSGEITPLLVQINGWEVVEDRKIVKRLKFPDFIKTVAFVNEVANLAEKEGHHPDLNIHGWNKLKITLSTHAIGGLSENDFILASKIDALPR